MFQKLLAVGMFSLACSVTLYASATDEAPAPRPVADKKVEDGKFGKLGGKLGTEKLKLLQEKFGKLDGERLKNLKGKIDPETLKELKEKFGDLKGKIDPVKLKELMGKFKKDGGD